MPYEIKDKIGQGTYGVVYKAIDVTTRKAYAVKTQQYQINDITEIIAMQTLNNENIISIKEIIEYSEQTIWGEQHLRDGIVMPLADMSLDTVIRNKLVVSNVKSMVYQLCNALSYMHCAGILHSDIKPNNILVYIYGDEERFVLADLGLCLFSYKGESTDGYYSTRTDSFALGMTLIFVLTGSMEVQIYPIRDLRHVLMTANVDDKLIDVLIALVDERETVSSVFGMPYFNEEARGVGLFGKQRIQYEKLSSINEAYTINNDVPWNFWDICLWNREEKISLFSLLRFIDLFYLFAPYITEVIPEASYISVNIEGTVFEDAIIDFSNQLICLAKKIENDAFKIFLDVSPMMMAWIKATNGLLYRRIISDISRNVDDFVNVIQNSSDSMSYDVNRLLLQTDGIASDNEEEVNQLTDLGEICDIENLPFCSRPIIPPPVIVVAPAVVSPPSPVIIPYHSPPRLRRGEPFPVYDPHNPIYAFH